mgnify:CR=1 FL=1
MIKDEEYWVRVQDRAIELKSDGCTGVPDFHLKCCLEHDAHYRLHCDMDGNPITKSEADKQFRLCIQQESKLGRFSPMSWWRWLGVKWFGRHSWTKHDTPK